MKDSPKVIPLVNELHLPSIFVLFWSVLSLYHQGSHQELKLAFATLKEISGIRSFIQMILLLAMARAMKRKPNISRLKWYFRSMR